MKSNRILGTLEAVLLIGVLIFCLLVLAADLTLGLVRRFDRAA